MEMHARVCIRRTREVVVASLVLGLMLAAMGPAGAQTEGGVGVLTATEDITPGPIQVPPPFFCSEVAAATYTASADGSYTATDALVVYVGSFEMTVTADDSFFVAPEGTYYGTSGVPGPKAPCGLDTLGPLAPVPASFTVFESGSIHKPGQPTEPCEGSGSFWRVNTDFHADWTLDSDCTVDDGSSDALAPAGTLHTMEAQQVPSGNPALVGVYSQTLH